MTPTISPPLLVRLFARQLGCHWTRLTVDSDGLHVCLADAPAQLIPWSDLAVDPRLHTGTLFHRLALPDAEAEDGAPGPAMPMLGWIGRWHRHFWRAFGQQLHQQHTPDFAQQLQRIEANVRRAYVRSSTWSQLQAQAAAVLSRSEAGLLHAPARPNIHYQRLKRIASGDACLLQRYREHYLDTQQARHRALFERIERLPLTPSQQRACMTLDDGNLVLAGAGSGKTSTLIGRAAYLIASGQAQPQDILLLAFGRQAANEMQQRLQQRLGIALDATTFHALGQRIMSAVEGRRPRISPLAQDDARLGRWMSQQLAALLETPEYRRQLLDYMVLFAHPSDTPFDFASAEEHQRFLHASAVRSLADEPVHSTAACMVADWLWSQDIDYRYQPAGIYAVPQSAGGHTAPVPDFYLPAQDICIDLVLLDENEATPTYVEPVAYRQQLDALRHATRAKGQRRIELFHYQQSDGSLIDTLARQLAKQGVAPQPKPDPSRLERLQERGLLQPFCELLTQLLRVSRSVPHDTEQLQARIDTRHESQRLEQGLALLQPLQARYRAQLQADGEIDFDDMIARALEYVEQGRFASPWQHILVDECQDISLLRARLIRALRNTVPGAALFAVGDDWQSIYRFAGSDVGLTTGFADFFGPASITALDQTFRFNSSIGALASRFVLKNPAQLPKQLRSGAEVDAPAVSMLKHHSRAPAADPAVLERVLQAVCQRSGDQHSSVLIMARNRFSLPDSARLAQLQQRFGQVQLDACTLHAAKGREADFAIILGLESGKYGFPADRSVHPLLDALLPGGETFPHAEERRLFYVALTRARHRVYLLYNGNRPSCFITELLTDPQYLLERDEFEPLNAAAH